MTTHEMRRRDVLQALRILSRANALDVSERAGYSEMQVRTVLDKLLDDGKVERLRTGQGYVWTVAK